MQELSQYATLLTPMLPVWVPFKDSLTTNLSDCWVTIQLIDTTLAVSFYHKTQPLISRQEYDATETDPTYWAQVSAEVNSIAQRITLQGDHNAAKRR